MKKFLLTTAFILAILFSFKVSNASYTVYIPEQGINAIYNVQTNSAIFLGQGELYTNRIIRPHDLTITGNGTGIWFDYQFLNNPQGAWVQRWTGTVTNWTPDAPPAPPAVPAVVGVKFLDLSSSTGETGLTNRLGASVATTSGSILPVVGVVGGIILAMIGIKFVLDTFKRVDKK